MLMRWSCRFRLEINVDYRSCVYVCMTMSLLSHSTIINVYICYSATQNLPGLALLSRGEDPRHHLLLRDQVVDPLQQPQKALHVAAPFVQHVVRIARLGEVDQSGWTVDLGVDRLRTDQLADVLLGFLLRQVQQFGQPAHLDTCVVLGHHPHVMLDHALAEVLPPPVWLVFDRLAGLRLEDIRVAEVRAELLAHHRPAHQLVDGEELH